MPSIFDKNSPLLPLLKPLLGLLAKLVKPGEQVQTATTNTYAFLTGREFGRWIDYADAAGTTRDIANGTATDPGYNDGALIDCPPYIIESIFRDEVFVERDLVHLGAGGSTTFTCNDVISRVDDYYNNAEYYNASVAAKRYIIDYVGSTNTFTINSSMTMVVANEFYLTNIQGDNKIDINSFDLIGNTTNGSRKNWIFGRTIDTKIGVRALIDELCFESHCMLFESINPDNANSLIKLVALDISTDEGVSIWTKPAFDKNTGLPLVNVGLTSLGNIFTSFRLFYHYDLGKREYSKEFFVDRNSVSSTATILGDYEKNLCKTAYSSYRIDNPFSYSAKWIYNDNTAEYFLQKKIRYLTKQRTEISWISGISDDNIDYISFERGDQVKLNYEMIPAGLKNSAYFMITEKRVVTYQGAPYIQWSLLEM